MTKSQLPETPFNARSNQPKLPEIFVQCSETHSHLNPIKIPLLIVHFLSRSKDSPYQFSDRFGWSTNLVQ
jgi:hypothetical protein